MTPSRASRRQAFSLLEILLALAILGGALTVLSQIASTGVDAAREARDLVMARMICQAKLSELLIATTVPQSVASLPVQSIDSGSVTDFVYSVEIQPGQLDGLLVVHVQVDAVNPNGGAPLVSYALYRWMVDPSLDLEGAEAEELAALEATPEEEL
jgi:general secretion pathway protein I